NGGDTGVITVNTGTSHLAAESAHAGTVLGDYTSSSEERRDGNPYLSGSGTTVGAIAVAKSDAVVCTFTNTRNTGSIEVKKTLSPAADPGLFELAVDGTVPAAGSGVGNGGDTGAVTVNTGSSHTAAESAHAGTVLGDYTS